MQRVLILNGPPRSGKDTLSEMLRRGEHFEGLLSCSFKRPLQDIAAAVIGMNPIDFMDRYEDIKDKPLQNGLNMTVRQLMIKISEDWIKPIAGKRYFGDQALKTILSHGIQQRGLVNPYQLKMPGATAVFTDGGFGDEVLPFIEHLGYENVHIVRIHRKGFDFTEDSRKYLCDIEDPRLAGCQFYDITNDESELGLLEKFMDVVFYPMRRKAVHGQSH